MLSTMYAIAAPFPGTNVSLASLGYTDVGLDDVWQQCGSYGPQNWTYHDANGNPVVNTARFPNMSALPATAHALGLTAGFYGNSEWRSRQHQGQAPRGNARALRPSLTPH